MARSNVPKFGNWENEDNVPYTVYFEKARKNRGGGPTINPNNPQENPEMFPDALPPPPKTKPDEPRDSKGEDDNRLPNKSPAGGENTDQRTANESTYGGGRGQRPNRPTRTSGGSEQSTNRSPLHPHHQAKVMGTGSAAPGWDAKNYDSARGDHGRSKLKPTTQGDESPDAGAAVPRFGEWDENDPSSAEQFTGIFDKVRAERNAGGGNISGTPRHSSHNNRGQRATKQPKCCVIL